MKYLFFAAGFLAATVVPCANGESKVAHIDGATVAVFMRFEGQPSETSLTEMKKEAQGIMGISNVRLDWHMLDDGSASDSYPDLVVVKFKGQCHMRGVPPQSDHEITLACTHTSGDEVLPFVDVECDAVRGLVGAAAHTADEAKRELLLGRAMGRVLAHEFYHVFAKTSRHGSHGVAKPTFTGRELVTDKFTFDAGDRKLLHLPQAPTVVKNALR